MNTTYINNTQHPELTEAVINQCGGWDDFIDLAQNVTEHGAAGGFSGFIYYSETGAFYNANRSIILKALQSFCEEIGEGSIAYLLSSFRCLNGLYSVAECESFLMGLGEDDEPEDWTQFENALAWWALEEVCRDYVDWEYSQDEPEEE